MRDKPKVHIGYIGTVNHEEHTLLHAIKIVEEKQKNGEIDMTKGIKNYRGCTILGYKFELDKVTSSKRRPMKGTKVSSGEKSFKGNTRLLKRNFLGK
jgi:translation initiation factor 2 gamma subunit (eIF-2gamma)